MYNKNLFISMIYLAQFLKFIENFKNKSIWNIRYEAAKHFRPFVVSKSKRWALDGKWEKKYRILVFICLKKNCLVSRF